MAKFHTLTATAALVAMIASGNNVHADSDSGSDYESMNGPNLIASPSHAVSDWETLQISVPKDIKVNSDGTLSCGGCAGVTFTGHTAANKAPLSLLLEITGYSSGDGYHVTPDGTSDICDGGWAIALPGAWNVDGSRIKYDSLFTFACKHPPDDPEGNSAAVKCLMTFNYDPHWPVPDYFQACTRMIRADYCGTGHSHTTEGNAVNVEDASHDAGWTRPDWFGEAAWGEGGAVCMNNDRLTGNVIDAEESEGCIIDKLAAGCLSRPFDATLLLKNANTTPPTFPISCLSCDAGSSCRRCNDSICRKPKDLCN